MAAAQSDPSSFDVVTLDVGGVVPGTRVAIQIMARKTQAFQVRSVLLYAGSSIVPQERHNAVWSEAARVPVANEGQLEGLSIEQGERSLTVGFADEMGRARQGVAVKQGPITDDSDYSMGDQVTFTEYDELGRQTETHLPYVSQGSQATGYEGAYNANALQAQKAFYEVPPDEVASVERPFAKTELQRSPLEIPERAVTAGNDEGEGERAEVTTEHRANTRLGDKVLRFQVVYAPADQAESTGFFWWDSWGDDPTRNFYPDADLYVTKTTDPNGRVSEEFTNKAGQTILKRAYLGDGGAGPTNDTYYAYDPHGRLRYILPPSGVVFLTDGGDLRPNPAYNPAPGENQNLGHYLEPYKAGAHLTRYVYDALGREVEKRIPEEEAIYTVYDRLGRVVARQDGPLRQENAWLFTKYDEQGREAITGVWRMDVITSRRDVQDFVDTGTVWFMDYSYDFSLYETRTACSANVDPSRNAAYTDTAFPHIADEEEERVVLLTQHYYDEYPGEYAETTEELWAETFDNLGLGTDVDDGQDGSGWWREWPTGNRTAWAGVSESDGDHVFRVRPDGTTVGIGHEYNVGWTSDPIGISEEAGSEDTHVRVSVDIEGAAPNAERFEYQPGAKEHVHARLYYRVDGEEVLADEWQAGDGSGRVTLEADGIRGSTLEVIVRVRILPDGPGSSYYPSVKLDDVRVERVTPADDGCDLYEAPRFRPVFMEDDHYLSDLHLDVGEGTGALDEYARGFRRSKRTLGKPTVSLVRVLHPDQDYVPGPVAADQGTPVGRHAVELAGWAENLEKAAHTDGIVKVSVQELQAWHQQQQQVTSDALVRGAALAEGETDALGALDEWLSNLSQLAAANGGVAYLDAASISSYNRSIGSVEAWIAQDNMRRLAQVPDEPFYGVADSAVVVGTASLPESGGAIDSTAFDFAALQASQNTMAADYQAIDKAVQVYGVAQRDWMATTTFYDRHGRAIQTHAETHLAERTQVRSTQFAFDGRALQSEADHRTVPGASVGRLQRVRLREATAYDHAGRPVRLYRNVLGEAGYVIAEETERNALGQITTRRLHGDPGERRFAQTVRYAYHPRGWLASMRAYGQGETILPKPQQGSERRTLGGGTLGARGMLALEYFYDTAADGAGGQALPGHEPLHDGTITGLRWQAPGQALTSAGGLPDGIAGGAYAYRYDALGRVTAGRHADYAPETGTYTAGDRYSLAEARYDGNGNLTYLLRCGRGGADSGAGSGSYAGQCAVGIGYGAIDELEYHYEDRHYYHVPKPAVAGQPQAYWSWGGSRPNRLVGVDDRSGSGQGFADGAGYWYGNLAGACTAEMQAAGYTHCGSPEYYYNANGGQRTDRGKGLDAAAYAVNSLPSWVRFEDVNLDEPEEQSGRVLWTYAATGARLRRAVEYAGQVESYTDYAGGAVLEEGLLSTVTTGQGQVRAQTGTDAARVRGWSSEYALRDHLGSVRARFGVEARRQSVAKAVSQGASRAAVQQYEEYYPYGMRLAGRSFIRDSGDDELYHGKRLDQAYGLDWTHYGWRYYDAERGRWVMVDPADEFYTAYSYVGGDPVNFTDPDGAQIGPRVWAAAETAWYSTFGFMHAPHDARNVSNSMGYANNTMMREFATNTGPESRAFGPGSAASISLANSNMTSVAVDAFHRGYVDYTLGLRPDIPSQYKVDFLLHGNSEYDTGYIEEFAVDGDFTQAQFVGSAMYYFNLDEQNNMLDIRVYDTKSAYSLFLHIPPRYGRDSI